MKKFSLGLIVLLSLSVAQPVMANGKMGPPAPSSVAMADDNSGLIQWLYSWF